MGLLASDSKHVCNIFQHCLQEAPPDEPATVPRDDSASELAKQQVCHANEMADVKKKFMSVARRKQQDYNKRVRHNLTGIRLVVASMARFKHECCGLHSMLACCGGMQPYFGVASICEQEVLLIIKCLNNICLFPC